MCSSEGLPPLTQPRVPPWVGARAGACVLACAVLLACVHVTSRGLCVPVSLCRGWVRSSLSPLSLRSFGLRSSLRSAFGVRVHPGGYVHSLSLSLRAPSSLLWWSVREVACFLAPFPDLLSSLWYFLHFLCSLLLLVSLSSLSLSLCWYSLSYHLWCSESFAVVRSYSHSSGTRSLNLSWILILRILVRFSLSL